MKKILSLFTLLLTAVMTFATDYTGKFTYTAVGFTDSFDSQMLTVTDNGDGTYDVTIKDFDASSKLNQTFGDMTFAAMPGTTNGGVTTIAATDVAVTHTDGTYFTFAASSVDVKFNDTKAYFHAAGLINDYHNFELTFGEDDFGDTPTDPTPVMTVYTDKLSATNGTSGEYGYTGSWDDGMMTTTDLGDGTYKVELDLSEDTYFGENFTFVCNATENEDGTVSLACDKYEYTLTYSSWAGYKGYITAEGKIYGDKLYAKVYVDYGGYAEKYPEYGYGYTFTFGTNPDVTDAVKGIAQENAGTISQVYTVGGAKTGSLQKGVNIVRLASGKTMKVLKK